tara:strand:- start:969 stop:1532 length:564 start_codon:yes stop_codon:yes gene_type:complete
MKSPFCFVVNPLNNKRYDNVKKIGDVDFIISSTKEDHTVSNRFAKVVSTPINYKGPIKKGDTLLVHHNVFKLYYDMKGREKSGRSFLKDNEFLVDESQFFAYKQKDKWFSHGEYCFIKPSLKEKSIIFSNDTYQPLTGEVCINNKILENLGVDQGDKVCFKPNSEYEFTIDEEKLYRVRCNNVTIKL